MRPRHSDTSIGPSGSASAVAHSTEDALGRDLADSELRYRLLVEQTAYLVFRLTPEGRFSDVNPALVETLGYESERDVVSLDVAGEVYLDQDDYDRLRDRVSGSSFSDWVETRWKRCDGTPVNVRVSMRAIRDEHGRRVCYDGVADDSTERHRHDEIVRRSERMASLGTTLAGVAHELNNPLAAILGFAQLLLRKDWPAEDRAALETINHEATRSATIVKDLLALARRREVERRLPTNLNDIAGYIVRTRRYSLETAGISCELRLQPGLPSVFGDRTQLEQVLLNLLNNAEQAVRAALEGPVASARPPIGLVRITTRREGAQVVLEVEDNGPGIPENARSRIWDPFWTTKGEGEGTGLGLAVVHGIVVDHGGTITLEGGPDDGAHFVIRFPVATGDDTGNRGGQALRPLDVLVVDPAASDLGFIERFLASRGHVVLNAPNVDLAIRLAEQGAFDAVVCDASLQYQGSPLSTALRERVGCASARFILASGGALGVTHAAPATLPDAVVVPRPYDVEELRRLIEGE